MISCKTNYDQWRHQESEVGGAKVRSPPVGSKGGAPVAVWGAPRSWKTSHKFCA